MSIENRYKENHYVPQWYQHQFLPSSGEQKFKYLDLQPEFFNDSNGILRKKKNLFRWGTNSCFKQTDLYTTKFASSESTEIEQFFFGRVDSLGRDAVEYFTNFAHPSVDGDAFHALLNYMSVQKLRTPKGLAELSELANLQNKNTALMAMQRFQNLHCATWTESVWAIAETENEGSGFIVSDHPVTVYNEDCFPASDWCHGHRDPEIWRTGTHTLFPLCRTKLLILTNLSWVRNPYLKAIELRPNPNPLRTAMFNFTQIQTGRLLSGVEVDQINFIIKKRAMRFVAAAQEDWLYPESRIPSEHWRKLNERYLLMPDPRSVRFTREIVVGYSKGHSDIFDEYGRRPGQKSFKDEMQSQKEWRTSLAFQGEFARLMGPKRRGRAFEVGKLDSAEDTPDFHQYHLDLETKYLPKGKRPHRDRRAN